MDSSLQSHAFVAALYAVGFIGFFGITLLPVRAFLNIRFFWRNRNRPLRCYAPPLIVAVLALPAAAFSALSLRAIVRCLMESHCGGNRSSGWFNLVAIGLVYLAYEALSRLALAISNRLFRVAG